MAEVTASINTPSPSPVSVPSPPAPNPTYHLQLVDSTGKTLFKFPVDFPQILTQEILNILVPD